MNKQRAIELAIEALAIRRTHYQDDANRAEREIETYVRTGIVVPDDVRGWYERRAQIVAEHDETIKFLRTL